ncbi:hypothetical protein PQR33_28090 [Paraburkholderia sediminicola]|uniref:hypothetical protein n=1 Tax=Paraburkholderia sediminicola TaxID=458836 RepID=UPI0038BAECF9
MTLMSLAEYSRRVGKSRAAVTQWKKAGRLVMQGDQVDVEASDERLKRYRREGMPDVVNDAPAVKRGRPTVKQTAELNIELNSEPVCLTCSEIARRLDELDWNQSFNWDVASQHERAVLAAQCIGWEAVQSPLRDDGHWGGYQLRIPGDHAVPMDGVPAGHGFELDVWDVLKFCRAELTPIDDEDTFIVRPGLLPLLAHPFGESEPKT